MDLRTDIRPVEAVPVSKRRSTAPTPNHQASAFDGATLTGEAAGQHAALRLGLWLDDSGRVKHARWRASPGADEPGLRDCAEAACAWLERLSDLRAADLDALRRGLAGQPARAEHAELVASALQVALSV